MTPDRHPAAARDATASPAPHMLIVDDDPGAVQILGRMLEGVGELRFASSGGEALRLARAERPDLVLLDADMPGMNGFEVFHAMKVEPDLARVPVIFVTSHREPAFEVEALGLGAADFISKPLMAEQVLARVWARLHGTEVATPAAATAMPPVKGPVRLLLVDCDESALHFERVALSPMVGTVQFARGGADALAQMACEVPDLVMAAANMPGLDGFALCRHMRGDPALHEVPLLLLGARADWRAEAYAFELGANDFVARPYPPAVLQARVRNLLRQARQSAMARQAARQAWQALADARVADLVAAAADPWIGVDAQGLVVLINAAASRLVGVDPQHAIGQQLPAWRGGAAPAPGEDACERPVASTWHLGDGASRVTVMRLEDPGAR